MIYFDFVVVRSEYIFMYALAQAIKSDPFVDPPRISLVQCLSICFIGIFS